MLQCACMSWTARGIVTDFLALTGRVIWKLVKLPSAAYNLRNLVQLTDSPYTQPLYDQTAPCFLMKKVLQRLVMTPVVRRAHAATFCVFVCFTVTVSLNAVHAKRNASCNHPEQGCGELKVIPMKYDSHSEIIDPRFEFKINESCSRGCRKLVVKIQHSEAKEVGKCRVRCMPNRTLYDVVISEHCQTKEDCCHVPEFYDWYQKADSDFNVTLSVSPRGKNCYGPRVSVTADLFVPIHGHCKSLPIYRRHPCCSKLPECYLNPTKDHFVTKLTVLPTHKENRVLGSDISFLPPKKKSLRNYNLTGYRITVQYSSVGEPNGCRLDQKTECFHVKTSTASNPVNTFSIKTSCKRNETNCLESFYFHHLWACDACTRGEGVKLTLKVLPLPWAEYEHKNSIPPWENETSKLDYEQTFLLRTFYDLHCSIPPYLDPPHLHCFDGRQLHPRSHGLQQQHFNVLEQQHSSGLGDLKEKIVNATHVNVTWKTREDIHLDSCPSRKKAAVYVSVNNEAMVVENASNCLVPVNTSTNMVISVKHFRSCGKGMKLMSPGSPSTSSSSPMNTPSPMPTGPSLKSNSSSPTNAAPTGQFSSIAVALLIVLFLASISIICTIRKIWKHLTRAPPPKINGESFYNQLKQLSRDQLDVFIDHLIAEQVLSLTDVHYPSIRRGENLAERCRVIDAHLQSDQPRYAVDIARRILSNSELFAQVQQPVVYISYSRHEPGHTTDILALVNLLADYGIRCEIDLNDQSIFDQNNLLWIESKIATCTGVLVVLSPSHHLVMNPQQVEQEEAEVNNAVSKLEAHIIRSCWVQNPSKVIPVNVGLSTLKTSPLFSIICKTYHCGCPPCDSMPDFRKLIYRICNVEQYATPQLDLAAGN